MTEQIDVVSEPVPVFIPRDGGERLPFAGMEFVIRASGATTGGRLSILEEIDAVDAPPHIHTREDELFFVLEGEHVYTVGHDEFTAGPGDVVHVPRGTRHAHRCLVPRVGRTLVIFSPAGMEDFFREISRADVSGVLDEELMDHITRRHGAEWVD